MFVLIDVVSSPETGTVYLIFNSETGEQKIPLHSTQEQDVIDFLERLIDRQSFTTQLLQWNFQVKFPHIIVSTKNTAFRAIIPAYMINRIRLATDSFINGEYF